MMRDMMHPMKAQCRAPHVRTTRLHLTMGLKDAASVQQERNSNPLHFVNCAPLVTKTNWVAQTPAPNARLEKCRVMDQKIKGKSVLNAPKANMRNFLAPQTAWPAHKTPKQTPTEPLAHAEQRIMLQKPSRE